MTFFFIIYFLKAANSYFVFPFYRTAFLPFPSLIVGLFSFIGFLESTGGLLFFVKASAKDLPF